MSKILIVEDDLSIQALLHDFIEDAGHSVVYTSHSSSLDSYIFLATSASTKVQFYK